MKNSLQKKIIKKFNLSKKNMIEHPLKALKNINIKKLTKVTTSAVTDSFKNFKVKIKQKKLKRIKLLKNEEIKGKEKKINRNK